jgi:hypothetical protein
MPCGGGLVSEQQPEDLETRVREFGRFLTEGTESELQEFIDEAPPELPDQPMELLVGFKALVDARLAAEPERKIIYRDDPHQIRLRHWNTIADRLEAEINFRTGRSPQNAPARLTKSQGRRGPEKDHEVAGRRVLVRQNTDLSDKELCELLDRRGVSVPKGWPEEGRKNWTEAYLSRSKRIHVIFSKDRSED